MTIRQTLLTLLNIISAFIGIVIGFRVIFYLVGANQATPIVAWINNMSSVFLYPFGGLFQMIILNSHSAIDVTAIIALLVYAVVFSVVYRIIYVLTHDTLRTEVTTHTHAGI